MTVASATVFLCSLLAINRFRMRLRPDAECVECAYFVRRERVSALHRRHRSQDLVNEPCRHFLLPPIIFGKMYYATFTGGLRLFRKQDGCYRGGVVSVWGKG